jgi:hypothetical protein
MTRKTLSPNQKTLSTLPPNLIATASTQLQTSKRIAVPQPSAQPHQSSPPHPATATKTTLALPLQSSTSFPNPRPTPNTLCIPHPTFSATLGLQTRISTSHNHPLSNATRRRPFFRRKPHHHPFPIQTSLPHAHRHVENRKLRFPPHRALHRNSAACAQTSV